MEVFNLISDLQHYLAKRRQDGHPIGFVPTMGALHTGHRSLVERARRDSDVVVASIFVNPTQFNDTADLDKYPRTEEADLQLLRGAGCDVVFLPSVEVMYPDGTEVSNPVDLGGLDEPMEGAQRPGHFAGVVQVVERLLRAVGPDLLFMGQKDFQQTAIVRRLIEVRALPVELIICPTVRAADGLAMSSRNVRLNEYERQHATLLYQTLSRVNRLKAVLSPPDLERMSLWALGAHEFRPEYFKIVDGKTLRELKTLEESDFPVACTAVWVGEVRLIDNMILT